MFSGLLHELKAQENSKSVVWMSHMKTHRNSRHKEEKIRGLRSYLMFVFLPNGKLRGGDGGGQ